MAPTSELTIAQGRQAHVNCRFLIGDSTGARDDLQKSLDLVPTFVQSWVKIASVHMELGELQ